MVHVYMVHRMHRVYVHRVHRLHVHMVHRMHRVYVHRVHMVHMVHVHMVHVHLPLEALEKLLQGPSRALPEAARGCQGLPLPLVAWRPFHTFPARWHSFPHHCL